LTIRGTLIRYILQIGDTGCKRGTKTSPGAECNIGDGIPQTTGAG
jgi:hypothetical protein